MSMTVDEAIAEVEKNIEDSAASPEEVILAAEVRRLRQEVECFEKHTPVLGGIARQAIAELSVDQKDADRFRWFGYALDTAPYDRIVRMMATSIVNHSMLCEMIDESIKSEDWKLG